MSAIAYGLPTPPAPPLIGSYYVVTANNGDNTASILRVLADGSTVLVATVPVGTAPYVAAASPDGSLIAVTNTSDDTVSIIDAAVDEVIDVVSVGSFPISGAWSPSGGLLAVANNSDDTVSIIDIASGLVIATPTVGTTPTGVCFAPDGGSYLAVTCEDGSIVMVETIGWSTIATAVVGSSLSALDIASDGSYIAVADGSGAVLIVDPSSLTVTQTITLPGPPSLVSIDPALAFVAATDTTDGTLVVIETSGWTIAQTVAIGGETLGVATAPDSTFVAVTDFIGGTVSIIETFSWTILSVTSVGASPYGVTIYPPAPPPPAETPTPKSLKNTWRWVVVGLDWTVKSYLDKLATNVHVEYVLDDSAQMTCDLPSDNSEIHQLADDGHPRVDYGRRVIFGLRREEPTGGPPWVCRFAGVISILQDQATEDEPITHLTAHDPWTWAKSLPVLNPDGSLLGANGLTYTGKTGNFIAKDLIANAYAWIVASFPDPMPWSEQGTGHHLPNDGQHNFIDIDNGHFDTTDIIPEINFAQGISVGEAWTQLCQTGSLDLILTPVYGQPGVLCVMNVYATAGKNRPNAVFGWDMFPRNLVAVDHLLDGSLIENWAQFYAGNLTAPLSPPGNPNDGSIDQYGPYFVQKNYPAPSSPAAVSLVALAEVELRKKGKQTLLIDPAPGLAPDPFTQYFLGDVVPVWAGRPLSPSGNALRGGIRSHNLGQNRVYGFQIDLAGDLQETVVNLLLTDPNATV